MISILPFPLGEDDEDSGGQPISRSGIGCGLLLVFVIFLIILWFLLIDHAWVHDEINTAASNAKDAS